MKNIVLYCKSYRNDVLRVKRLTESIAQFNHDQIPLYVSVPLCDMDLFQGALAGKPVNLINDEEIIRANPSLNQEKIDALPGAVSQQIVKSEFWRLGLSDSYLCIDSDCVFIRPFYIGDFISPDNHPYTVMHEAKEFLQFAVNHNQEKAYNSYHSYRAKLMTIIGRKGRHFDFGPVPVIWNGKIWSKLDTQFLQPLNLNIYDAILLLPSEILWYGEAMLKFRLFPIEPIEPLFKVYHNELQFIIGQQQGDSIERISKNYLGICYQSNWQRNFDFEQKPLLSRLARWIRRKIFRRYN